MANGKSETTERAMIIAKVYLGSFFQMTWDEATDDMRREALNAAMRAVKLIEDQRL